MASFGRSLGAALCARGVEDAPARLVGEVAISVFRVAFERWWPMATGATCPR
jgi:hypothetical protein